MYRFLTKPYYFIYVDAIGQIMTLQGSFYALPKTLNGTTENTLLNKVIKRRIADLKSIPTTNNKQKLPKYTLYPNLCNIVIDTIFEDTQILKEYIKKPFDVEEKIKEEVAPAGTEASELTAEQIKEIKEKVQKLTAEQIQQMQEEHDKAEEMAQKKHNNANRKRKERYIATIKAIFDDLISQKEIDDYYLLDPKNNKIDKYKDGVSVRAIHPVFKDKKA